MLFNESKTAQYTVFNVYQYNVHTICWTKISLKNSKQCMYFMAVTASLKEAKDIVQFTIVTSKLTR